MINKNSSKTHFFFIFICFLSFFLKWNSSNEVFLLYHQINYILISIYLCCGRLNDKKFFTPLISGNKTTFFGLICHYLEETFHSFKNYCLFSFYLFHIPKKITISKSEHIPASIYFSQWSFNYFMTEVPNI